MEQKIKTISDYWLKQNKLKHKEDDWGIGGIGFLTPIDNFAQEIGAQTILDYGCGKGRLEQFLIEKGYDVYNYDPATFGDQITFPADLVVCTDMMEHVEIEYIDIILDYIKQLAIVGIFFVISTRSAINL